MKKKNEARPKKKCKMMPLLACLCKLRALKCYIKSVNTAILKGEHHLGIQEVYYAIRYIFLRVILMYVLKYLFHARMVDLIKTLSLMDQIF